MINFHFGNKKPDRNQIIIISIILTTLIAALSQCSGVSENTIWDFVDEIQRKYFPESVIGEIIRKDPEKIERRVKRDVDKAIKEYERLTGDDGIVKLPSPLYSEIEGVMRLCSPWIEGCTGVPLEEYKEEKIEIKNIKVEKNTVELFKF